MRTDRLYDFLTLIALGASGLICLKLGYEQAGLMLLGSVAGAAKPVGLFNGKGGGGAAVVGLVLLALLTCGSGCGDARAQTVYITQKTQGTVINSNCAAATNPNRWTGFIPVNTFSSAVFDVDFVEDGAGTLVRSVDMTCQSSRSSATAFGAGRDVDVIVSTAASGVSSKKTSTWREDPISGAVLGTKNFTTEVANVPAPFLACTFVCCTNNAVPCTGGGDATDTIAVFARKVTP